MDMYEECFFAQFLLKQECIKCGGPRAGLYAFWPKGHMKYGLHC